MIDGREGGRGFHSCFAFLRAVDEYHVREDGRSAYLPHVCGHPPAIITRVGVRHLAGSTSGTSLGAARTNWVSGLPLIAHGGFDEDVAASEKIIETPHLKTGRRTLYYAT